MNLSDYQQMANGYAANDLTREMSIATAALGLAGEAGETADLLKKILGHGHPYTHVERDKLAKELGDVLWYVARLASLHGFNLSVVASQNLAKLEARYPAGFSSERSINRTS